MKHVKKTPTMPRISRLGGHNLLAVWLFYFDCVQGGGFVCGGTLCEPGIGKAMAMSNLEVSRLLAKCFVFPIAGMAFGKVLSILATSGYPWNLFGITLILIVGYGVTIQLRSWQRQAKKLMRQLEIDNETT